MTLIITTPDFEASVQTYNGVARDVGEYGPPARDPRLAFMRTWTYDEIERYCVAKGWKLRRG